MNFVPIDYIRELYNPGPGRHWFDKDSARFFKTRFPEGGYCTDDGKHTFFVTSEQGPSSPRAYSVRILTYEENGKYDVHTLHPFNAYSSTFANRIARDLATGKLILTYENYRWTFAETMKDQSARDQRKLAHDNHTGA